MAQLDSASVYVNEALHLEKYPPTIDLKLQAIRIGELAITGIPCEVFAETGLQIKKDSPHKATFVMGLANGYGGYLPPPRNTNWVATKRGPPGRVFSKLRPNRGFEK